MDLKPTRMLGIIIAAVQIFSLLAFGLSLHSIFDVIFNTVSEESLKIEMNIDESTYSGVLNLEAMPSNRGFLGVNLALELDVLDEKGEYIVRNSTLVHLASGERKPLYLSLHIPNEEIQKILQEGKEPSLELSIDLKTLNDLVGISNIMTIQGGKFQ